MCDNGNKVGMTLLIIFFFLLFQDVYTEACEQLFSWLSKFAIMTKQMNRWHFLFIMLYVLDQHNMDRIKCVDGGE